MGKNSWHYEQAEEIFDFQENVQESSLLNFAVVLLAGSAMISPVLIYAVQGRGTPANWVYAAISLIIACAGLYYLVKRKKDDIQFPVGVTGFTIRSFAPDISTHPLRWNEITDIRNISISRCIRLTNTEKWPLVEVSYNLKEFDRLLRMIIEKTRFAYRNGPVPKEFRRSIPEGMVMITCVVLGLFLLLFFASIRQDNLLMAWVSGLTFVCGTGIAAFLFFFLSWEISAVHLYDDHFTVKKTFTTLHIPYSEVGWVKLATSFPAQGKSILYNSLDIYVTLKNARRFRVHPPGSNVFLLYRVLHDQVRAVNRQGAEIIPFPLKGTTMPMGKSGL